MDRTQIEKFLTNGCAPPLQPKWKVITQQLQSEMNLVIELDQVKMNFSTGLGGMDHVRKATNFEKMEV